jgi:3-hydroxybutyryl-CoA dehydratase
MMPIYEDIAIGQRAERTTKITSDLIKSFAALTGDDNPVHLDDDYASKSFFRRRVAHGAISAALISTVLGTELPGTGTIYLSQDLVFKNPVFPEDTVTVAVEVLEKNDKSKKIKLRTTATKQDGLLVIDGVAVVMLR